MDVREATDSELGFVGERVLEASFPPGSVPSVLPDDAPHVERWFPIDLVSPNFAYVASIDSRLVGALVGRVFPSSMVGSYGVVDETAPEIAISVLVSDRGLGVAGALLAQAQRGSGRWGMSLTVSRQNPIAIRLYESHGFVVHASTERVEIMTWKPARRLWRGRRSKWLTSGRTLGQTFLSRPWELRSRR